MRRTDHLPAARALALLRVAMGSVLVLSAIGKFTWYRVGGAVPVPVAAAQWQVDLPQRLATWLARHPDGIVAAVVRDLLLPNGGLVAGGVAWGQMAAGILLVLGLWTRLAAGAAVLVAAALAMAAASGGLGSARPYVLMAVVAGAFIVGRAGDLWGMDGWRHERRRNREL